MMKLGDDMKVEETKFEEGSRVQFFDANSELKLKTGIVIDVLRSKHKVYPAQYWRLTAKELEEYIHYYMVKTDDGKEIKLKENILQKEDNDLEREYRETAYAMEKIIDIKIEEALHILAQAEEIAEKNCIPFRAAVSPLAQPYLPKSFKTSKFAELDKGFISQVSGIYPDDYMSSGWQHSEVC